MAGTVSSASARPARDILSVLAAPVVRREGTRIVVVVCGEADGRWPSAPRGPRQAAPPTGGRSWGT